MTYEKPNVIVMTESDVKELLGQGSACTTSFSQTVCVGDAQFAPSICTGFSPGWSISL